MKPFTTKTLFCGLWLAASAACASAQSIEAVTEASAFTSMSAGKVGGPATDIVEATLRRAGLTDYRIGMYPWARAYDMARQDPNVLIYLIARTPERDATFKWVGSVVKLQTHFYKLRSRADVVVRSMDDAKRYSVGVARDDVRAQFLQREGFVRLAVAAQSIDNFRKLLAGQIELMPLLDREAPLLCEQAGADCDKLEKVFTVSPLSMDLNLAFSQQTADATVARAREAFEHLKAEGTVARLLKERR